MANFKDSMNWWGHVSIVKKKLFYCNKWWKLQPISLLSIEMLYKYFMFKTLCKVQVLATPLSYLRLCFLWSELQCRCLFTFFYWAFSQFHFEFLLLGTLEGRKKKDLKKKFFLAIEQGELLLNTSKVSDRPKNSSVTRQMSRVGAYTLTLCHIGAQRRIYRALHLPKKQWKPAIAYSLGGKHMEWWLGDKTREFGPG